MNLDALLRTAQILRAQPACSMPLLKLHTRLCDELGPEVGTYSQVYLQLKKRPQSFTIIDTPRLMESANEWPLHLREEYNTALEGAGIGSCVRVALTESSTEESAPSMLALAGSTVTELWSAAEDDSVLRQLLTRAADQLEEINALLAGAVEDHPTTLPRDPQP